MSVSNGSPSPQSKKRKFLPSMKPPVPRRSSQIDRAEDSELVSVRNIGLSGRMSSQPQLNKRDLVNQSTEINMRKRLNSA